MRKRFLVLSALILFIAGFDVPGFCAAKYKGPELSALPDGVQKTIEANLQGGKIRCIDEGIDNDELFFTIEATKNCHDFAFEVGADGSLNRIQVDLSETPVAVQKAIHSEAGRAKIDRIDKVFGDDDVTYEIDMTRSNRERSFSVAEDGTLLCKELFLDELSSRLKKAIRKNVGSGRLDDIFVIIEDGEMSYSIGYTRHRKALSFSLDKKGKLVNAVVLLEDTPPVVQGAIRAKLQNGYLEQIALYIDNGKSTYEVTYTVDDETDSFEVSRDGKIINGMEPVDGVPKISA